MQKHDLPEFRAHFYLKPTKLEKFHTFLKMTINQLYRNIHIMLGWVFYMTGTLWFYSNVKDWAINGTDLVCLSACAGSILLASLNFATVLAISYEGPNFTKWKLT